MYGSVGLELLAIMIFSYDGFSYFAAGGFSNCPFPGADV
jgi:hypothetical protein